MEGPSGQTSDYPLTVAFAFVVGILAGVATLSRYRTAYRAMA